MLALYTLGPGDVHTHRADSCRSKNAPGRVDSGDGTCVQPVEPDGAYCPAEQTVHTTAWSRE